MNAKRAWPQNARNVLVHPVALVMIALVCCCSKQAKKKDAAVTPPSKPLTLDLGAGAEMEFVLIPPGSFAMGSEWGDSDEMPVHHVTITKPFYMGKYEVTQEQWKAVMGKNPSHFKGGRKPVETVSWNGSQEFVKKLNEKHPGRKFRLPTEAEWEYACRAGSTTAYCYGDNESALGDYGWYLANSDGKTHPVGQKKHNAWGLHDMHGNVWEWCTDWDAGKYPEGSVTDPTGPGSGRARVLRGGGWDDGADGCRSAYRDYHFPDARSYVIGFRLSWTP